MVTHLESNKKGSQVFWLDIPHISFISHTSCHHSVNNGNSDWTFRKEPWARILASRSLTRVCVAGSALATSHWTVGGTILVFWEKSNIVTLLDRPALKPIEEREGKKVGGKEAAENDQVIELVTTCP